MDVSVDGTMVIEKVGGSSRQRLKLHIYMTFTL
jgi:hypothetical protein